MSRFIGELGKKVLNGYLITPNEAFQILEIEGPDLFDLLAWANRIRAAFKGNRIHLCSIVNVKSGGCSEDCSFCAQSAHYNTSVSRYSFMETEQVLEAVQEAKTNGAQALGLVAAWRGVKEGPILDEVCQRIQELSNSGKVRADASLGIIENGEVARRLKEAGLRCYNHNLEASRSFFPHICTTHTYDERVQTIRYLKAVGIKICCGGIFGMGETKTQRVELAMELRDLDVDFVPLNFLHPISGTPLGNAEPLTPLEILKTIALFRYVLPLKNIMVAGGRELNLRDLQGMMFTAGANATIVGNYLTTKGRSAAEDLQLLRDLGLEWDYKEEELWE